MELAKDYLDLGIYTDRYEAMRHFYVDEIGLPYEELLKAGRGVHQHRLSLNGAVLKLNSSRESLIETPTNFRGFDIGTDTRASGAFHDPDGTRVNLVSGGAVCVYWASSDPGRLADLLVSGLGATEQTRGLMSIGRTLLALEPGGGPVGPLRSRGLRYLTVQVRDVRLEHQRLITCGWTEQSAPVRLGDTAFISFVSDPDGAMVEVSQRASLTGPLP